MEKHIDQMLKKLYNFTVLCPELTDFQNNIILYLR